MSMIAGDRRGPYEIIEPIGEGAIYRKDASGTGLEERLTEGGDPKLPLDWSKDGRYILYRTGATTGLRDLLALPLAGDRKPIPVVNTQFAESAAAISPDGRWVAYASNDSGSYQLYVQAFPGEAAGLSSNDWRASRSDGHAAMRSAHPISRGCSSRG